MGRSIAGLAIAILLITAAAQAEEPTVTAYADAAKIGESDSLQFTIEVRGSSLPGVEEPDLSALADFAIASGPSVATSTSMFWDGGGAKATSTKKFSYVLLPKRRGALTIPSFAVIVGGKPLRTSSVKVEVVAGSARPSRPGPFVTGPFERPGRERRSAGVEGDIFIEVTLDRKEAYLGQQVLLSYKVYTQVDLASLPQPKQLPAYTGFWVEEIPVNPQASIRRTVLRGKEYAEITLAKKALFPARSGDLKIDETVYEILARTTSDDPFDRFLTPAQALYRRTPALTLKVLPLPEAGKPASFQGAVGRFTLDVRTDRRDTQVNDAIALTVKVEGDGNLRALGEPVIPDLPDYRRYDPKVEDDRKIAEDRILGSRTWSYVLVPLAAGEKTIPPVRFAYFDPSAATYKELMGPPLTVKVARGAGALPGADAGGVRREVVAVRRDIRYIKPASDLRGGLRIRHSGWFYILLILPVAANAALYAHLRRRDHLAANESLFRRRRARRAARGRLKEARALMAKADEAAFFAEVDRAVTGYIADKFNESPAGLTRERIVALLQEREIAEDLRRRVLSCLERCDLGRFAARSSAGDQIGALMNQAEDVISNLEHALG